MVFSSFVRHAIRQTNTLTKETEMQPFSMCTYGKSVARRCRVSDRHWRRPNGESIGFRIFPIWPEVMTLFHHSFYWHCLRTEITIRFLIFFFLRFCSSLSLFADDSGCSMPDEHLDSILWLFLKIFFVAMACMWSLKNGISSSVEQRNRFDAVRCYCMCRHCPKCGNRKIRFCWRHFSFVIVVAFVAEFHFFFS